MPGWVWRPAQLPAGTSAMPVTVVKPGGNSTVCSGVRLMAACCAIAETTTTGATTAAMTNDFFNTGVLPGKVRISPAWNPRRGRDDSPYLMKCATFRKQALSQQIVELGMLAHIGGNKRAFGDDLEPLSADLLQRAAHEARPDAAARQFLGHLRVREGDDAGHHAVVGEGGVPVGVELEPMLGDVVADAIGHGGASP